ELAACACPVVMGPHTFNFEQASQAALSVGAAQRVPDMASGIQAALQWIADAARYDTAMQASLSLAQSHQGAALHTAQALRPWLE
ncbi:MAG: 3-deoxy-D-manno-octulosonic acid transferase, partial [Betaproteobacteria bacterium]|nr:3-deoxy-D-manno-octulosonic acid transferase [Betaproteobacteria bacterium]